MKLVPRIVGVALVALAFTGGGDAALADDIMSVNAGLVALPAFLPLSAQDPLLSTDDSSSTRAQSQKYDFQNGNLDFFSVKPESRSGDFTSLLGSGAGGGGLKLRLNW
jgi:hypothetical protein